MSKQVRVGGFMSKSIYNGNGIYKKGTDPEVTCWHCNNTFLCDPMDATCRLCGAPFSKSRCKEFKFIPKRRGAL